MQNLNTVLLWIISIEHVHIILYVIFLVSILISDKSPEGMVSWIFTITIFPFLGFFLYLIFGINWRKNRIISLKENKKGNKKNIRNFLKYDPYDFFHSEELKILKNHDEIKGIKLNPEEIEISKMLNETEKTYLTSNKSYEMYYSGKDAFTSIIQDIKNAKKSILMEYFIWRSDELGEQIKNLLLEKAKQGLEIKLLFDGLGSMGTISKKYRKELSEVGVEFRYFLDIKFSILKFNYRNHRKMTIIDHKILHTGGMNLGEEYITGGKKIETWRDTNARIEGEILNQYLTIFFTDWLNSGGEIGSIKGKIDEIIEGNRVLDKNPYLMQVSSSGPDTVWTSLKFLYSKMIGTSKSEVLIQSPYFVPDAGIISQLKIASLSGVKIKIMMTGVPDKKIPYWIAETYFEELLLAGVEIYRYKKGFLHCKNVIVDEKICTMGTCNFDMRSFEINYEINIVYYNEKISKDMKKQFLEDLKYCEKIEEEKFEKLKYRKKIRNSIFKVFSPIM